MSLDGMERMAKEEYRAARPRVFGTNPDEPEKGGVFIWTTMGWLERMEGPWGDVAFTPVADDEAQLRDWLAQSDPNVDLVELNDEFGKNVFAEFMEDEPLYPESPETSSQEPFDEQDVT